MNDYLNNKYPEYDDYSGIRHSELSYEDYEKLKRLYTELSEFSKDLNIKMNLSKIESSK